MSRQPISVPVSVVIPCFNCTDTVARAVESVLAQSYSCREIILIDDGSIDDGRTLAVLYRLQNLYACDIDIMVIHQEVNAGPAHARNIGWEHASQEYIAFLDSDDTWHYEKIRIQYSLMERNPDIVISGHMCPYLSENKTISLPSTELRIQRVRRLNLFLSNIFKTPTVMVKSEMPYRFDASKRHSEDYLLWLQIICSGDKMGFIKFPLAFLHKPPFGAGGLSGNMRDMEIGELKTWINLYKQKLIGLPILTIMCLFSIAKYGRRLSVISIGRRLFGHSS